MSIQRDLIVHIQKRRPVVDTLGHYSFRPKVVSQILELYWLRGRADKGRWSKMALALLVTPAAII